MSHNYEGELNDFIIAVFYFECFRKKSFLVRRGHLFLIIETELILNRNLIGIELELN